METEKRVASGLKVESRAEGESKKIVGYAAVFDSPTDIGGYWIEQIARGAFAEAVTRDDVRALVDHDESRILGRNKAGTLQLQEDDHGLRIEIDPPDTQAGRDIVVSIARGDVTGMSFAFRAIRQEWDESGELARRTILEAELLDVSVVTYPAYPDTEVGLRSLEGIRKEKRGQTARRLRMRHTLRERELAR